MNAPSLWDSVPFASTTTPPMSAILVYCYIPFLHDVSVSFLLPLVNWISWPSAFVQGLCHPHGCAAPPTHERVKESTLYDSRDYDDRHTCASIRFLTKWDRANQPPTVRSTRGRPWFKNLDCNTILPTLSPRLQGFISYHCIYDSI